MDDKNYAVITGDLVDSTGIEDDYKEILAGIASDIGNHQDEEFKFDWMEILQLDVLLKLLIAHLLADFIFQSDKIVEEKNKGLSS